MCQQCLHKTTKVNIMKSEKHSKGFLETLNLWHAVVYHLPAYLDHFLSNSVVQISTLLCHQRACSNKISSTAGLKQNYIAQLQISAAESTALSKVFNFGSKATDWPRCAVLICDSAYWDIQSNWWLRSKTIVRASWSKTLLILDLNKFIDTKCVRHILYCRHSIMASS